MDLITDEILRLTERCDALERANAILKVKSNDNQLKLKGTRMAALKCTSGVNALGNAIQNANANVMLILEQLKCHCETLLKCTANDTIEVPTDGTVRPSLETIHKIKVENDYEETAHDDDSNYDMPFVSDIFSSMVSQIPSDNAMRITLNDSPDSFMRYHNDNAVNKSESLKKQKNFNEISKLSENVKKLKTNDKTPAKESNKSPNVCSNSVKNAKNKSLRIPENHEIYTCKVKKCAFRTKHLANLKRHELTHSKEKPFKCNICRRLFSQSSNMKRHYELHFKGKLNDKLKNTKNVITQTKDNKSEQKTNLNVHKKREKQIKKNWKCDFPECRCAFMTRDSLRRHQIETHQCLSESIFDSSKSLRKYFAFFTPSLESVNSVEISWICKCTKRYRSKGSLMNHIKKHHTNGDDKVKVKKIKDEKTIKCPYNGCDYSTLVKRNVKRHIRTHIMRRQFQCLIKRCDFIGREMIALKEHVLDCHSEQQFMRAMQSVGVIYPEW